MRSYEMTDSANTDGIAVPTDKNTRPKLGGLDYHVASVTKATPPTGMEGADWHQYVLEGGHSPITGWRRGSLADVKAYAQVSADELNERRAGKNVYYQRGRPRQNAASG
jgi:hypothetical protein